MSAGINSSGLSSLESIGKMCIRRGISGLPISFKEAKKMVSLVPDEWFDCDTYIMDTFFDKDAYTNNHRVLDISCNSGVLLEHFYYRFMQELARAIPDTDEREDYILKNLLYAFTLDSSIPTVLRNRFYWSTRCHGNIFQYNILTHQGQDKQRIRYSNGKLYILDKKIGDFKEMKFDVVCGNPPYQGENSRSSVYQKFLNKMYDLSNRYVISINPAKWNITIQDNEFDEVRHKFLSTGNLVKIHYFEADNQSKTDIFKDAQTGDLVYFISDKLKTTDTATFVEHTQKRGIVTSRNRSILNSDNIMLYDSMAQLILDKVKLKSKTFLVSRFENTTDSEFRTDCLINPSSSYRFSSTFSKDTIKVYSTKMSYGFCSKSELRNNYTCLNKYKVLLMTTLASSYIAEPNSVGSRSFYMFWFDTKLEADNCKYFMDNCKLFKYLVLVSSATYRASKQSFRYVPLLDFTKLWDDASVYKFFNFTSDEINYIESYN